MHRAERGTTLGQAGGHGDLFGKYHPGQLALCDAVGNLVIIIVRGGQPTDQIMVAILVGELLDELGDLSVARIAVHHGKL